MKSFSEQLNDRRHALRRTMRDLQAVTGIAQANLSYILAGKRGVQSPTLEALGDALDAKWVLVPKHLLPEVERLLSGKPIGPDEIPSTVDRLFGANPHE
jgi:transcriptional regulator with XRE-family HTH domain